MGTSLVLQEFGHNAKYWTIIPPPDTMKRNIEFHGVSSKSHRHISLKTKRGTTTVNHEGLTQSKTATDVGLPQTIISIVD